MTAIGMGPQLDRLQNRLPWAGVSGRCRGGARTQEGSSSSKMKGGGAAGVKSTQQQQRGHRHLHGRLRCTGILR